METLYSYAQPFFEWLLHSTVQAGMVICLILLIQALLRNRLTARWHYALWLILVVRMVLPWAPQSRFSIYNLTAWQTKSNVPAHVTSEQDAEPAKTPAEPSTAPQTTTAPQSAGTTEGQVESLPAATGTSQASQDSAAHTLFGLSGVLPFVWLAGALLLGGYIIICNLRLWRAASVECPSTDKETLELLEECRAAIGLRTIVALVPSETVKTPILLGFVRPRLLVPKNIAKKLSREELRYIFLHELAHVKRHDIALGWLTALLQVVHWFNPLVWLAFHRMRSSREAACDALVLSRMQGEETQNYGLAIVSLLEHFSVPQPLPGLAGILETKSQLKRRIAMITQFKHNSYRWSVTGIGIIAVLGAISMTDATRGTASAGSAPQAKAPMTMRRVETQTTGYVSISPDGRYLCDCDTFLTEGIIIIRNLATGEQRTVKPTKEKPQEGDLRCPVMSPDNKTIAYLVERPGETDDNLQSADVRLIGADGSGQRVLCRGAVSGGRVVHLAPKPIQWFPDGSRLLALGWPDRIRASKEIEIVSVSIADGSIHVIKKLTGSFFNAVIRLSPDGKYVAYDVPSKEDPAKRDIFAVGIDSQQEALLVGHPADDKLLDWTPDGRHIMFISDRAGPWGVWLLPVANGQARGAPEQVARDIGDVAPVGFAGNGSYYYRLAYNYGNVYNATINLTTGQVVSAPAPLEATGMNLYADWSPDGKCLAYCSYAAPVVATEPGVIRIRSLATGEERELVHKVPVIFRCIRWSPDGRSFIASQLLAYKPEDTAWPMRVCRIDVETGDSTVLLDTKPNPSITSNVSLAELSPDGKILYYSGGPIVRRQLDTGEEKTIFTYPAKGPWAGWALSPNGEFVATGCNEGTGKNQWEGGVKKVLLIPSQGGQATELVRWEEPTGMITNVAWSRDSKTVLFTLYRQSVTGGNAQMVDEFWQVTTDGGQPRKIMETGGLCYGLRVHPDGQRVVFSSAGRRHELWAMENFLPAGASAKDLK